MTKEDTEISAYISIFPFLSNLTIQQLASSTTTVLTFTLFKLTFLVSPCPSREAPLLMLEKTFSLIPWPVERRWDWGDHCQVAFHHGTRRSCQWAVFLTLAFFKLASLARPCPVTEELVFLLCEAFSLIPVGLSDTENGHTGSR